jgi:hypothetical protein
LTQRDALEVRDVLPGGELGVRPSVDVFKQEVRDATASEGSIVLNGCSFHGGFILDLNCLALKHGGAKDTPKALGTHLARTVAYVFDSEDPMSTSRRLPILAGLAALAGISAGLSTGCVVAEREHYRYYDGYRYEHGDRVDRRGRREHRWCEEHRDYEHCRDRY